MNQKVEQRGTESPSNSESGGKKRYKTLLPYVIVSLIGLLVILLYIKNSGFVKKEENFDQGLLVAESENVEKNQKAYYEIKDMIVQLDSRKQERFLRITLNLQVENKTALEKISDILPQVEDVIQSYLRQLEPDNLSSSFSIYKIRSDILLRVNTVIYPERIEAVYVKDIFVK